MPWKLQLYMEAHLRSHDRVPPSRPTRPKVKIGVSLDAELYDWVLQRIGAGGEFASVSHALERALAFYQQTVARREAANGGKAHS